MHKFKFVISHSFFLRYLWATSSKNFKLPHVHLLCSLIQGVKIDDLPKIKKIGNYQSEEVYLDTHFRLLREECFYKLRKGISGFVANNSQFDSKDMMMYR